MNSVTAGLNREKLVRVRPAFLLVCAIALVVLVLPETIKGIVWLERLLLVIAAAAIIAGWFLLFRQNTDGNRWRASIALVASTYLTIAIPAYFLAFFARTWWLVQHHVFWIFLRPWASCGYVLAYFGAIGSFFGRGRARVLFALGGTILAILLEATGKWI